MRREVVAGLTGRRGACLLIGLLGLAVATGPVSAAEQTAIRDSVARAAGYLRSNRGNSNEGQQILMAYALLKAGLPVNSPEISEVVATIRGRVTDGVYKAGQYHHYEAGISAMLLAEVGGEPEGGEPHPYLTELQAIADYEESMQLSNGGWDYPPGDARVTQGDTSVIQYALLALWAARRSGAQVTPTVWQNAIQWHVANQGKDGGFAYVPGTHHGFGQGASVLNMTINGIGSTYIALSQLSAGKLPELKNPKIDRTVEKGPEPEKKKFGVLEKVDLDKSTDDRVREQIKAEIPQATAQLLSRAYDWIVPRFVPINEDTGFRAYYYYSLERMAALADVQTIGDEDWFNVCADYLIAHQEGGGSWKLSTFQADERVDTAFAVLFLTRSTAKILKKTIPVDPIGGGLLSGGRGGLDGSTKPGEKKPIGALDQLLASLDAAGEQELADVQDQFIEQVQIGDRNALIGQTELLVKYIKHVNPEIRRTAVWALGRTDNLSLGRYLINALDDPDLSVVIEARNALCWLSRRPNGLGEAGDPLEALPADASEDQQAAAITTWQVDMLKRWGRWYLENRPYADRGDEFEAELLQKLAAAM
jgi:hypothetical protein